MEQQNQTRRIINYNVQNKKIKIKNKKILQKEKKLGMFTHLLDVRNKKIQFIIIFCSPKVLNKVI